MQMLSLHLWRDVPMCIHETAYAAVHVRLQGRCGLHLRIFRQTLKPETSAAASVPENSVFQASDRKSGRLSGHMIDRPPIRMPIEPKLAKPQIA